MPITAVRPETGATIRPGPMVTVLPEREVAEDRYTDFAADSGLNGPFLADQLSAFVTHERMGINLVRTLHARSDNPALRARYADLEGETLRAVGVWETLIGQLAGATSTPAPPAGRPRASTPRRSRRCCSADRPTRSPSSRPDCRPT